VICGRSSGKASSACCRIGPLSKRVLAMKSLNEIFGRNTGLFEYTHQGSDFQHAMIGHNTAGRATAHYDVTSALTSDCETEPFQGANDIGPRDVGQLRHVRALGTTSAEGAH